MFHRLVRHKLVSILFTVSTMAALGGFSWALILFGRASGPFIVHFDDLRGITTAAGQGTIVFAGIFGIIVVFINGCLAFEFEERNSFFGKLTAVLTLVFAVLLFIAFAAILSVN